MQGIPITLQQTPLMTSIKEIQKVKRHLGNPKSKSKLKESLAKF